MEMGRADPGGQHQAGMIAGHNCRSASRRHLAALHHLFWQRVRSGSMLLKKSVADAVHATIESRRSAIRIKVASSLGLLNQSCAAGPSKSFFNTIGQNEPPTSRPTATGPPQKAAVKAGGRHLGCGPFAAIRLNWKNQRRHSGARSAYISTLRNSPATRRRSRMRSLSRLNPRRSARRSESTLPGSINASMRWVSSLSMQ